MLDGEGPLMRDAPLHTTSKPYSHISRFIERPGLSPVITQWGGDGDVYGGFSMVNK